MGTVSDMLAVERTGPGGTVARVTLNRPDVHNAFNASLIAELRTTFAALARQGPTDLRAVVLVGKTAAKAQRTLENIGLAVFLSDHPSPLVRASLPARWHAIPSEWAKVNAIVQ